MSGDPFWSDVVFLSGFEGGALVDESSLGQTITTTGAAQSTAQAKFGTQSLKFTTINADTATVPDNAAFFSGSDPFTIEGFFQWTSPLATGWHALVSKEKYDTGDDLTNRGWSLGLNWTGSSGGLQLLINDVTYGAGNSTAVATWTPTVGTWYHIAVDWDGVTFRLYVDGVTVGAATMEDVTGVPGAVLDQVNPPQPMQLGAELDDTTVLGGFRGYMDEVRVTAGAARYASDVGFTPLTDAFPRGSAGGGGSSSDTLSDGIKVNEGATHSTGGVLWLGYTPIPLAVAPTLAVLRQAAPVASDVVGVNPVVDAIYCAVAALTDTIQAAPALVASHAPVLRELARLTVATSPSLISSQALADRALLTDGFNSFYPVALIEAATLADAMADLWTTRLSDNVLLDGGAAASALFGIALAQALTLSDAVAAGFGEGWSDAWAFTDTLSVAALLTPQLTESVALSEALSPQFLLRVEVDDVVAITPSDALQMLFGGIIADGVTLTAGYLAPDGNFTTWAMNTLTGAVTEYTNYAFNSFAQLGDRYVAASDTGLYELLGDDDDGTDIVARLRGGFMQFGGGHLSRLKAAYIAARGSGDFVLKIETGDGQSYSYGVSTRDMRSTKVHMGKGQRARYFLFDLTSDGADFDIDSLEFVPIVLQRRV